MTDATTDAQPALLDAWLAEWYAPAYRTARMILPNPADAEDAVQDAFLRLWRFRDSIPEGDGARAWLYRVVVNACFSRARSERRAQRGRDDSEGGDLDERPGSLNGPDQATIAGLDARAIREAVAALPDALRVPLVLRYFAGLSESEIATAIHRRPGTVKSRLHEAKRRLESDAALGRATREGR